MKEKKGSFKRRRRRGKQAYFEGKSDDSSRYVVLRPPITNRVPTPGPMTTRAMYGVPPTNRATTISPYMSPNMSPNMSPRYYSPPVYQHRHSESRCFICEKNSKSQQQRYTSNNTSVNYAAHNGQFQCDCPHCQTTIDVDDPAVLLEQTLGCLCMPVEASVILGSNVVSTLNSMTQSLRHVAENAFRTVNRKIDRALVKAELMVNRATNTEVFRATPYYHHPNMAGDVSHMVYNASGHVQPFYPNYSHSLPSHMGYGTIF